MIIVMFDRDDKRRVLVSAWRIRERTDTTRLTSIGSK